MKKLIALLLVLSCVLGLSACKKDNQTKTYFYVSLDEVGDYLKKHFNIDAKINFWIYDPSDHGFVTEGAVNEYSRNGEKLTHPQVLDIIKNS